MKSLFSKLSKEGIYFIVAAMLIGLNIVMYNLYYQSQISFKIDSEKYKYASDNDKKIIFKGDQNNNITITVEDKEQTIPGLFLAAKYNVQYKNNIIKCDNSDFLRDDNKLDSTPKGERITLLDGTIYVRDVFQVIGSNNYSNKIKTPMEVELVSKITKAYKFSKKKDDLIAIIIITIPLILLGLFGIMYPKKVWRMQHYFDVSGGEPTDWAIFSNRFGGVVIIAMAIFAPFLKS